MAKSTENADSGLELFDGLALGLPAIFFATRKAWNSKKLTKRYQQVACDTIPGDFGWF